jgi:hypothetical protein
MPVGDRPSSLARAVAEIEQHVSGDGWDQGPRLFALALTTDLLSREPALADRLGLEAKAPAAGQLTPVEQELPDRELEDVLATIAWPGTVIGCALALERIVLPPDAEAGMPTNAAEAAAWAARHPDRADVRLVVAVMRDGARSAVLRIRGHDDDSELLHGPELAPDVANALAATFTD